MSSESIKYRYSPLEFLIPKLRDAPGPWFTCVFIIKSGRLF